MFFNGTFEHRTYFFSKEEYKCATYRIDTGFVDAVNDIIQKNWHERMVISLMDKITDVLLSADIKLTLASFQTGLSPEKVKVSDNTGMYGKALPSTPIA